MSQTSDDVRVFDASRWVDGMRPQADRREGGSRMSGFGFQQMNPCRLYREGLDRQFEASRG